MFLLPDARYSRAMSVCEANAFIMHAQAAYAPVMNALAVHADHRWALSPISVISDIGLSLISESPISD